MTTDTMTSRRAHIMVIAYRYRFLLGMTSFGLMMLGRHFMPLFWLGFLGVWVYMFAVCSCFMKARRAAAQSDGATNRPAADR